jgi:homoserine dehydrogenase
VLHLHSLNTDDIAPSWCHPCFAYITMSTTKRMLPQPSQVNVALLGFGNVGRAFASYVKTNKALPIRINITAVADTSGGLFLDHNATIESAVTHKEAGRFLSEFAPNLSILGSYEFVRALPSAGISVLVESLPTNIINGEPALGLITAALAQGTNVVTVDKGPLVHGLASLREAEARGASRLGFTGTTGVSIPDELTTDRVLEIRGVLNGTTNYILSEMQQHQRSFDEALDTAQAQGIAEPDPSLDVEGWDTASKVLILANSLMGANAHLAEVSRTGIGLQTESLIRIARESGRVVRLVGRARIWQGRVRVSVAPKLVRPDSPFYSVSGTSKAAVFRTETQGEVLALGRSGRDAISQTIVDDIARIMSKP